MKVFLTSVGLFFFAFTVHFILWRYQLPKQHIKTLLIIFGVVFCLWLLGAITYSARVFEVIHVALFYGSVSLCYVITYSAIEADSPTLSLIRFLAEGKSKGRSPDEVSQFMAQRPFVRTRLSALVHSGLIREDGLRFVAVGRQPLSFRVILGFRKLYGPISRGG
jgi:hypothetical protein